MSTRKVRAGFNNNNCNHRAGGIYKTKMVRLNQAGEEQEALVDRYGDGVPRLPPRCDIDAILG